MPASMIPSFAKKTGKSETEVERLWHKAKGLAAEQGHSEEYDYIVGILKRMLKINESDEVETLEESTQVELELFKKITGKLTIADVSTLKRVAKILDDVEDVSESILEDTHSTELVTEEVQSDFNGLTVYGDLITLDVRRAKFNNLMEILIKGNFTLSNLKSAERLKDEYREEDWDTIEKIWSKLSAKYGSKIEKQIKKFEQDLNNTIIDMEKELDKF